MHFFRSVAKLAFNRNSKRQVKKVQRIVALACCLLVISSSGPGFAVLLHSEVGLDAETPASPPSPILVKEAKNDEVAAGKPFLGLTDGILVDPSTGAATASIPIEVPPGRLGVTPVVRIAYRSGAPNGLLGLGWNLAMGSVIRDPIEGIPFDYSGPMPTDYASASFVVTIPGHSLRFDTAVPGASDCSSLGGQRYRQSEELYWAEACLLQSSNSWQVTDAAGVVYEFGRATEARAGLDVDRVVGTASWALDRIVDSRGNSISIRHDPNTVVGAGNPYSYVSEIEYGGNEDAAIPHVFKINFAYESRRDVFRSFAAGYESVLDRRLVSIATELQGAEVRRYQFEYTQEPTTNESMLGSVALVLPNSVGGESLPPTTFAYTEFSGGFEDSSIPLALFPVPGALEPNLNLAPYWSLRSSRLHSISGTFPHDANRDQHLFLDVDGDGLPEFLDGSDEAGIYSYRNLGHGTFGVREQAPLWNDIAVSYQSVSIASVQPYDMDGDSIVDLLRNTGCWQPLRSGNSLEPCSYEVSFGTGAAMSEPVSWPNAMPFRGRMLPMAQLSWVLQSPHPFGQVADLTGDGRADVLHCPEIRYWNGSGWVDDPNWRHGGLFSGIEPWYRCLLLANTGTGFAEPMDWSIPAISGYPGEHMSLWYGPIMRMSNDHLWTVSGKARSVGADANYLFLSILDVTGDGLSDLVSSHGAPLTASWMVAPNTGIGFGEWEPFPAPKSWHWNVPNYIQEIGRGNQDSVFWSGVNQAQIYNLQADINGDGRVDDVQGEGCAVALWSTEGFRTPIQLSDCPDGFRPSWQQSANWYSGGTPLSNFENSSLMDLNGDGLADYVYMTGFNPSAYVRLMKGPRYGLLSRVESGLGTIWEAEYASVKEPASGNLYEPAPIWWTPTLC